MHNKMILALNPNFKLHNYKEKCVYTTYKCIVHIIYKYYLDVPMKSI